VPPVDSVVLAIPGFCQPVSSLSHLIAACVALAAAVPLIRLGRGNRVRVVAVAFYATCVVGMLAISGAYHSLEWGAPERQFMKRLDYFAIWLLIGGTFTAVHGVMCRGFWRTGVLAFIWSYALCGVLLQVFYFQVFSGIAGLMLYLGLGAVGVVSIVKLGREIGYAAVRPLWMAGIAYSAGAVLEATGHPVFIERWVGPHEIFHGAVLVGVTLHWFFIRSLLVKHVTRSARPLPVPVPAAPAAATASA
jgi:channel protein (hemolysin III family)